MLKGLFGVVLVAVLSVMGEEFPRFSQARAVTCGPHEHFFANYYAINAWSPDARFILVLRTDKREGLPSETEPAELGLVDLKDANTFIPLTETRAWNFQEGCMAHWLGKENRFIYNDFIDGTFVSVIFDVATKTKRVIPRPVSAVFPDGRTAVGINYARLRLTRPDYGYGGKGQDARAAEPYPQDDGLWLIDLETGAARLAVSVASVKDRAETLKDPRGLFYFCHVTCSRDGKKIFWLARGASNLYGQQKGSIRHTTDAFVCDADGSNVTRVFPDGWAGSHYDWKDGETMFVSAQWQAKGQWSHVLVKPGKNEFRRVGGGLLDFDGHATFSPDGQWLLSDSYPDRYFERKLFVVRLADDAILPLGTYFVPENYRTGKFQYSRCDLHARWRPDGRQIGFNSVHEGTRQVYLMDVEK